MDILLIVTPIVVGICTIATFFIARSHDAHKRGKESGELATDIVYIKKRIDDIFDSQKQIKETLAEHAVQIGVLNESTKTAQKRIDSLEDKMSRKRTKEN